MSYAKLSTQFFKFLLAGAVNTLLSYLLFLFFYWLGFHYSLALALVSVVTIPHAYMWQRYWIFKSQRKILQEFLKFIIVYVFAFFVNLSGLSVLVEWGEMDPRWAEILAIAVAMIVTFLAQKYWSFSPRRL